MALPDYNSADRNRGYKIVNRDKVPQARCDGDLSLRERLFSAEELAKNLELRPATLADWRSQGKGPAYFKTGRVIWYPKDRVEAWIEAQMREGSTSDGTPNQGRDVALPLQARRKAVHQNNRLGRHTTKRDRGARQRGGTSSGTARGTRPRRFSCGRKPIIAHPRTATAGSRRVSPARWNFSDARQ